MTVQLNRSIGKFAKYLLDDREQTRHQLCEALDLSIASLNRRIRGELAWTAEEVAGMSDFFDVPVQAFFAGQPVTARAIDLRQQPVMQIRQRGATDTGGYRTGTGRPATRPVAGGVAQLVKPGAARYGVKASTTRAAA
jgi:hypothetical protein